MKYLILLAFIASLASIICGYVLDNIDNQKLIGIGVLGLFFIVIPLFSYHRWKNKSVQDYMLTKEKIQEMRIKEGDKRKL